MVGRSENKKSLPLLDQFGGMRILDAAIIDFCDQVLGSDIVGQSLKNVDMAQLTIHRPNFFTSILGRPAKFMEQRLASAHLRSSVIDRRINEIAMLPRETLTDAGFAPVDLTKTLKVVELRRSLIVR